MSQCKIRTVAAPWDSWYVLNGPAMIAIAPQDSVLTPQVVWRWAGMYPIQYDTKHYYPWLASARQGNIVALERITEWKNVSGVSPNLLPMPLSGKKQIAFRRLVQGLQKYLNKGGRTSLEQDFAISAPVYSIFWAHVLFGAPIFDVFTHISFAYFDRGVRYTKSQARIFQPKHWSLYGTFEIWSARQLAALQKLDPSIDQRTFDRALFQWGRHYKA